jgi:hypothetical protein
MQQRNSLAAARWLPEKSSTDFADYTDLGCKHDKGFSNLRKSA